jgi:hypothetical protein
MSTLKVRKKSRFNTAEAGGIEWDKADLYGVRFNAKKANRNRRKIRREREAQRQIEAHRQAQDRNVSWDEVKVLLDEGMTLEEAKELCRSGNSSGKPGRNS